MTTNSKGQALFVRLDRIGDLVLTLPVDQRLGFESVHWWIPQGLGFVTQSSIPERNSTETPRTIDFTGFFRLLKNVRRNGYSVAVIFHAPWWVGLLLWLARVPVRVGVRSQWHSFLFFNRGIRQKRSRADASELEFNYRLVEDGFGLERGSIPRETLKLAAGTAILGRLGLPSSGYTVVHPGMSGSALNWPTHRYAELIRLRMKTEPVVITGTASDEKFLTPLKALFSGETGIHWLDGKLNGRELIEVLANAKAVIAPSTGVLHLAASTGVKTIGIYSPVRVQRALRWGPQGDNATAIEPAVVCPGEMQCLGPACPHFNCMDRITATEISERCNSR